MIGSIDFFVHVVKTCDIVIVSQVVFEREVKEIFVVRDEYEVRMPVSLQIKGLYESDNKTKGYI